MANIFITGSADGLGQMAARLLIAQGRRVVLHARNGQRALDATTRRLATANRNAPYVLTALMHRPRRLVYLSSGLHRSGDASLRDLTWADRTWNGTQAYSDGWPAAKTRQRR